MKNLKNQITLVIIKYMHLSAENLNIMSLLLTWIIIENFHRTYGFCSYLYMSINMLFYINFISNKTLDKKKYILFFRILVIKVIDPIRW